MEAFTLLKYWRASSGTGGGATTLLTGGSTFNARAATKNICTTPPARPYSDYGEDGPYFDLEFTLTDEAEEEALEKCLENDEASEKTETESGSDADELFENENDEGKETELKFSLASDEIQITDQNVMLSPSNELFFKGHLVPIEPSSIILNGSEENSKFPVSLLKSATKFRVLLLKLKKSKSANGVLENAEKNGQKNQGKVSNKLFTVQFKVEEVKGPLFSLFARDNSKELRHSVQDSDSNSASDDRKLTKEVVQKYFKMLKPLYIRVSSRYVEKMKTFSGQVSFPAGGGSKGGSAVSPPRKHLGKSRSTSSAVAVSPPGKTASNRLDDSLLELQDGIQGAILHCKRSFNSSRDGESAVLSRSVSDPSHEKSAITPTASSASTSVLHSWEAKETTV